jgi:hypothetical protein
MVRTTLLLILLVGCSSPSSAPSSTTNPDAGEDDGASSADSTSTSQSTWTVSGTIAGYTLQDEIHDVIARRIDDPSGLYTGISFTSQQGECAKACSVASRRVHITFQGTQPGSYQVVQKNTRPDVGEVTVEFLSVNATCTLVAPVLRATKGTLMVTEADLTSGGHVAFRFEFDTAKGSASGSARASACAN